MNSMSCTDSKVEQMFKLLLDAEEKDQDKKQKVSLISSPVGEKYESDLEYHLMPSLLETAWW